MPEIVRLGAGAVGAGLLGTAVAVLLAVVYVAANDWFGASDIGAFAFWSAPFAVVFASVALLTRRWLQQFSGVRSYGLSGLIGSAYGLVWTFAVALGLGPWVGAFSVPILYLWMLAGLTGMLSWTLWVRRLRPGGAPPALPRTSTVKRLLILVLGMPVAAVAVAFGVTFGSVYGSMYIWDRAEPELHLIPAGFEGPVLIIFNDPNGAPPNYEGKSRLYEIPPSGVLRTQFAPNDGWSQPVYMYVDRQGNRTPIVTGAPCEDLADDPVQACLMGRRIGVNGQPSPEYLGYVVSQAANRRELYARGDSLVSAILFDNR